MIQSVEPNLSARIWRSIEKLNFQILQNNKAEHIIQIICQIISFISMQFLLHNNITQEPVINTIHKMSIDLEIIISKLIEEIIVKYITLIVAQLLTRQIVRLPVFHTIVLQTKKCSHFINVRQKSTLSTTIKVILLTNNSIFVKKLKKLHINI